MTAAFDGGAITSNAGALLLRRIDRSIGLFDRVAGCFTDGRDPRLTEHSVHTLVAQRITGIALGYEDLNDHDFLRHDPLLALLSGKLEGGRKGCAVLAGKSTLNRSNMRPGRASRGAITRSPTIRRRFRRCSPNCSSSPGRGGCRRLGSCSTSTWSYPDWVDTFKRWIPTRRCHHGRKRTEVRA